ncbi:uncharacterized protein ddias [Fundulus heteroclitus]|uniref:uncharacterized protein ddias n=1 Tax=Fundulus heteroclitus TaxID=8078 RepID=UPI00165B254A|nr:uncharacterized protein ddias [Fundulus heteroclitus]
MSVRRVLVGCTVLSVQDSCVFYPCCEGCFSRLDAEQRGSIRYRCSRCGYWCLKDQVDYRYRLSLWVVRDASTFGVTVFGNSLNAFFGIHASGLQRLVDNWEEPVGTSARSTLLAKAVQDCFLGRYFIFGIKVSGTEREPWLEHPDGNESGRRERAQFVATQMILPTASGPTGCTVLSYFQRLLQKASEHVAESVDCSKAFRPLTAPLLLIAGPSPKSSARDVSPYPSGLLSHSLLGLPLQDHTFASTSPWQQSLGLETSSAVQEEGCSQDGGDENRRLTGSNTTPHPVQRVYPEDHPGTVQLECSFHCSPSPAGYSRSSCKYDVGSSFSADTRFSQSRQRYKSYSLAPEELPTTQQSKSFLSSSVAWDEFPFSESLAEFLCEQNRAFDLQDQKQASSTFVETANLPAEQASACQIVSIDKLKDVTNLLPPGGDGENVLSVQGGKSWTERLNKSEGAGIPQHEEVLLFSEEQDGHNEMDGYNCSADLFGDSLTMGMHTETDATLAQTVSSPSNACLQRADLNDQNLRNAHKSVSHSTPKLKSNLWMKRDSLCLQDVDFVPPSQLSPTAAPCRNLKCSKENLMRSMRSGTCENQVTPRRRLRKPEKMKDRLPVGERVMVPGGALMYASPRRTCQKQESEASHVTVCDYEGGEGVIAPTPTRKMQPGVALRKGRRSVNWSCIRKGSGGDGGFSRDQTQAEFDRSEDQLSEDGNQTRDWSRDLFSDSL